MCLRYVQKLSPPCGRLSKIVGANTVSSYLNSIVVFGEYESEKRMRSLISNVIEECTCMPRCRYESNASTVSNILSKTSGDGILYEDFWAETIAQGASRSNVAFQRSLDVDEVLCEHHVSHASWVSMNMQRFQTLTCLQKQRKKNAKQGKESALEDICKPNIF